jgi:hypothetical protein
MHTSHTPAGGWARTLAGLLAVPVLLTGCGGGDKPGSGPASPRATGQATSSALTTGGAVAAADVKPVDLKAFGYQALVTNKATLAGFPVLHLPFASTCPGVKELVPNADGSGGSAIKITGPILVAQGLRAPFIVSTLNVSPTDLVAAIQKAVAGCTDVRVLVAPNTPKAGVTRIQVNYRTPKFNNGANGGRAMAGLTYIATLKDGSYVISDLFGDPTVPQIAPRYDLTDPFTIKLLNAAGIA